MKEFELGFLYGAMQASLENPFDIAVKAAQAKSDEYKQGVAQGYSWGTVNAVSNDEESESSEDESSDIDGPDIEGSDMEDSDIGEISESRHYNPNHRYMMICDATRLQKVQDTDVELYTDGTNNVHVVEKYDKNNLTTLKAKVKTDKDTKIVGQDDNNVYVETSDSVIEDADSDSYTLEKVSATKYNVIKNGVPTYVLEQHGGSWTCTCPGFKYRRKCRHLALLSDVLPKRHPRAEFNDILPTIREIMNRYGSEYNEQTHQGSWAIVGSYRRNKPTYKDVDILIECSVSEFQRLAQDLEDMPGYKSTMTGNDIIRGRLTIETNGSHDIDFDVTRVRFPKEWGSYLLYRTGSARFNMKLRGLAKKLGMSLNEHGLFDAATGEVIASETEDDILKALGLNYISPENRDL